MAYVLIVDDDVEICRFLERALARHGLATRSASCADNVRVAVDDSHPAFIFLDAALAGSDAVEALQILARARYGGPVQLMSGRSAPILGDIERVGRRRGLRMLPSVMKPVRLAKLDSVLQEAGLVRANAPVSPLELYREMHFVNFRYRPLIDPQTLQAVSMRAEAGLQVPGTEEILTVRLSEPPSGDGRHALSALYDAALESARRQKASDPALPCAASIAIGLDLLIDGKLPRLLSERDITASAAPSVVVSLSEDEVVRRPADVEEIATQLRLRGVSVAVAGAGTRYLSQIGLDPLPICEVHLDAKLVLAGGHRAEVIVDLVHRSGSKAVVANVQSHEQARLLGQAGCDLCSLAIAA